MSASRMAVDVRLFAILRERAGADSVTLELAPGATVADAIAQLSALDALKDVLARLPVQMAVNRDYATPATVLEPGDELALIPPVSGGGALHVRVSEEEPSLQRVSEAVADPGAGAIVVFQGVTRSVERLHYEAYVEMAREQIEAILRECVQAHGLLGAAAEHRVGDVPLGRPSVVVAVSAAHREEAFAGAREAIDRIKATAPIFKREHEGGRAEWVQGTVPKGAA